MKIFLSWSGARSRAIASAFNDMLPHVIQAIEPFFSAEIERGAKYLEELDRALQSTGFGIVCLTPDNLTSQWIHYEVGALWKTPGSRIWTFLHGIDKSGIPFPLGTFQHTGETKSDVLALLQSINRTLPTAGNLQVSPEVLTRSFEVAWPSFEAKLEAAGKLSDANESDATKSDALLGIQSVYQHLADQNLAEWLAKAERIRVLKTWFPETKEILEGLQAGIASGVRVELLMCNPESKLLQRRSYNANNKRDWEAPVVVYQAVRDIHELLSPDSTNVEFRFYDDWPGCPAIWYGDDLLMGFYFRGRPSPHWPWVRITKDSVLARILNNQFDELWESTPKTERLRTAGEREGWLQKYSKWAQRPNV